MSRIIVDATTGTVINIENAFILDDTNLSVTDKQILDDWEQSGSDDKICNLASRVGECLNIFSGPSFSPYSLREEAFCYIESHDYGEECCIGNMFEAMNWAANTATLEELSDITQQILNDERLWEMFTELVREGILDAMPPSILNEKNNF